jgi:MFS family permease
MPVKSRENSASRLLLTAAAAFAAYFCVYAFRKPFTAATFEDSSTTAPIIGQLGLKTVLVLSQLLGYTLSKFIGIKVVSEMGSQYRAWAIIGLIGFSELALVGFAFMPIPFKVLMIFLNGLPLGMIFGLILSFLEGRKQTEALSAALCASFIVSSGVVKSVGSWLVQDWGVSEYSMPMVTGIIFLLPLLIAVWILQRTPPPDQQDRELRSERPAMNSKDRRRFLNAYWPGLSLLVVVYVALTIVRTVRDDFAVEIWRDMGVQRTPSVFTTSEMWVGIVVTAFCGLMIWVKNNWLAIRLTIALMSVSFVLVLLSAVLQGFGSMSPFAFMVSCGIGLYIPYVAFHTTVFERLIAVSRLPSNLGFLMYVADSIGYLGYAVMIVIRTQLNDPQSLLPFFRLTLFSTASLSIVCLIAAWIYFHRKLAGMIDRVAQSPETEKRSTVIPEKVMVS